VVQIVGKDLNVLGERVIEFVDLGVHLTCFTKEQRR
jgi:hypothetical protein